MTSKPIAMAALEAFAKDGEDLFRGQEGSCKSGSVSTAPLVLGNGYDVESYYIASKGDGIGALLKRENLQSLSPKRSQGPARIHIHKAMMGCFFTGHQI